MLKFAVRNGKCQITTFVLLSFIILFLHQNVFAAPTVTITPDKTIADKFVRHTVTGITTPLPQSPDVPGFLGASFVAVGDLKHNGTLSIVSSSGEGIDGDYSKPTSPNGAIAVFTCNGRDLDSWKQGIINDTFVFPNVPVLVDMDGDRNLDILVGDNFVVGMVTHFHAGIYWLENKRGDLTKPENWIKHTIYEGGDSATGITGLMRVAVLDVDGDGKNDIITSRMDLGTWIGTAPLPPPAAPPASEPQYSFMEVFRQEDPDYVENDADGAGKGGTCYGYSRHVIGDGGGFQFDLADIDGDGDLDIYAPQFLITYSGSKIVRPDIHGDSLIWFENPGPTAAALAPWTRHTISNNNTSGNPIGRGFVVLNEDIDSDGKKELIFSSNNYPYYKDGHRLWPAGVFYLDIPGDPAAPENWSAPITIDSGDPSLDPDNASAVARDLYAADREGDPNVTGAPGDIKTGDINNDGYLDLVVPGDSKGAVYYYESNGSSPEALKFKRATMYADQGTTTGGCAIVDIDGDGDLDIVQGIYDTSVLQPGDEGYVKLASSSIFVYENTTINKKCPVKKVLGADNPKLENLRDFRDSSLAQSAIGRKAIQIYYNNADTINAALDRSPALLSATRRVLEVIAPMVGKK